MRHHGNLDKERDLVFVWRKVHLVLCRWHWHFENWKKEKKNDCTVLCSASHIGNDAAVCRRSLASPVSPSYNVKASMEDWRNDSNGWNRSTSRKSCPNATLRVKNITQASRESNPGFRGARPATNRLRHGTDVGNWKTW